VKLGVVPETVQKLIENIEKTGGVAKVIGAGGRTGGAGIVLALRPSS
jgi:mevalonate kinase